MAHTESERGGKRKMWGDRGSERERERDYISLYRIG